MIVVTGDHEHQGGRSHVGFHRSSFFNLVQGSHRKIYEEHDLLAGPIREANLPGVAQYNLAGIQVSFSDVGEVSGRVSVLARPTAKAELWAKGSSFPLPEIGPRPGVKA